MEMNKQKLLAIVGPTASGKTSLSILLAKRLGGEILSCDSMQIYRGMDIGTAKPTEQEKAGVPHHLLDLADADTPFSCAEYVKAASSVIDELSAKGSLPVLCGGTGLYLDALLRGGGFEETDTDPALREELFAFAAQHGNHALHERLAAIDPESAAAIHENNVKRVVRALEIHHTSGITKSEADRRSRIPES
ncbi:MAG: tRNA (adenosine(37)-N6)-dimethylallyltransferase MiaA, partial [Clostridia bacterium]|nr:tRNA (adenosine(37)-N6)-dimethylallyltransferase MiaA [Clostridia bacterium]